MVSMASYQFMLAGNGRLVERSENTWMPGRIQHMLYVPISYTSTISVDLLVYGSPSRRGKCATDRSITACTSKWLLLIA